VPLPRHRGGMEDEPAVTKAEPAISKEFFDFEFSLGKLLLLRPSVPMGLERERRDTLLVEFSSPKPKRVKVLHPAATEHVKALHPMSRCWIPIALLLQLLLLPPIFGFEPKFVTAALLDSTLRPRPISADVGWLLLLLRAELVGGLRLGVVVVRGGLSSWGGRFLWWRCRIRVVGRSTVAVAAQQAPWRLRGSWPPGTRI
jgi:hypothetical protein